ncbi:MAG: type IV pilus twitching motility protein PilT [Victivallaceae bacterium]
MQLDVQWFIYALVSNEILSVNEAVALHNSLGNEVDLGSYAQAIVERLSHGVPENELDQLVEQIQSIVEYAISQEETKEVPDIFANGIPDVPPLSGGGAEAHLESLIGDVSGIVGATTLEELPPLDNVLELDDAGVARLMIELLTGLRSLGASDLHISANSPPFIRRSLKLERLGSRVVTAEESARLNMVMLDPERKRKFEEQLDLSFALEVGPKRFRIALMMQKDGIAGSYRLVPNHIRSLEELGYLPKDVATIKRFLDHHNGLVLVTGPIGSGKTSTLAAMADVVNEKRQDHIITVEDPIEILQFSKNCQVTQREVGRHTNSYRSALKAALREDPDVIIIGEMHDLETIENAITASETGHLVIGTLHTSDAANTLNRMLDVFPPMQQPQIRAMTSGSLRGIICQRLIPDINGNLTVAYEILVNSTAVGNIISEGKTHQLKATIQIGQKLGMCTLDQCLLEKYSQNHISYEVALDYMKDAATITQLKQLYATRQAQGLAAGKK